MRNLKSFFILLSVLVVIGSFAVYTYMFSDWTEKEGKGKAFPNVIKSEVQSISIKNPHQSHFQLIRRESMWRLEGGESGIKDIADRDRVDEWLGAIFDAEIIYIKEESPNWPNYGLDKSFQTIELSFKSNEKQKVDISLQKSFDDKFFLRRGEELLLGEEEWSDLAGKSEQFFRSYKLINTEEKIRKFHYRSKKKEVTLEMEDYDWKWAKDSPQKNFPLSQSAVDNYVTALSRLRLSDTAEFFSKTEDLQKKYNLLKPFVQMELEFDKGKKLSLSLGSKVKDPYYVMVSDREYIFSMTDDEAKRVLLSIEDFKDHNFPFRVERDLVHFIELKSDSLNVSLRKERNKWVLNQDSDRELNTKESDQLLNRIRDISAEKYFGDKAFTVKSQIILRDTKEDIVLSMELSAPFKIKTEESEMIYVKSNLGAETMSIYVDTFEKIFSSKLFKEKQKDESLEGKESDTN